MATETVMCPCDNINKKYEFPDYEKLAKISQISITSECVKPIIYRTLFTSSSSSNDVNNNAISSDSENSSDVCDCEHPVCTGTEKCEKCESDINDIIKVIKCTLADDLIRKKTDIIDAEKETCMCDKNDLCIHKFESFLAIPISNCTIIGDKMLELISDERKTKYEKRVKEMFGLDCDACCEASSSSIECECTESSASTESEKDCIYRKPIVLKHLDNYHAYSCLHLPCVEPYKRNCQSKSTFVAKWGNSQGVVESVLKDRDKFEIHGEVTLKEQETNFEDNISNDCNNGNSQVCQRKIHKTGGPDDLFDDINRFKNVKKCGFAKLCRTLLRWSHYTMKNFQRIQKSPHIVIHIPSLSYPKCIRRRMSKCLGTLQAIQIGRLGWLKNPNAQVIYVYPCKSNEGNIEALRKFVTAARPDVDLSKLWIIQLNGDNSNGRNCCKNASAIEDLFYTPVSYRRVRHLSAGRRSFIISGIMNETDTIVASELQTPILGSCVRFQKRLLNKYYMMSNLEEAGITVPPFCKVQSCTDIFDCFASLLIAFPQYDIWFLKINYGFNGYQTAIINLNERLIKLLRLLPSELLLIECLKHRIPKSLHIDKAYKNKCDFFADLEKYGGIIQACPNADYKTFTLGCINKHDTATPHLLTTAEVIKCDSDIRTDIGYIISQNLLPESYLKNLTTRIGDLLHEELYVGFFGIDIVVFTTSENEQKYWVIDVDPCYTDLHSFADWTNFCLMDYKDANVPNETNHTSVVKRKPQIRTVVCSGKLYSEGFEDCYNFSLMDKCKEEGVLYSTKGKTGCMICPYDPERRNILIFSIHCSKEIAVTNFITALRVLYKITSSKDKSEVNNILELARDLEKYQQFQ